jgi:hypothetical protein
MGLSRTVEAIRRDMRQIARSVAREDVSVTCYGAFDIHPKHLVYWICVTTDAEKHRLEDDGALMERLRDVLVSRRYPPEGRDFVHIGFESQETVDRESDGDWWQHWK